MVSNDILDIIMLVSIILNGLTIAILMIIWQYSREHTLAALSANFFHKTRAICARWTVDHKLKIDIPKIDPLDPFKWSIKKSKDVWSDREVKKGSVVRGPDNIDYVIITDDCTSTINLDERTASKVGSSPAYVQKMQDLSYAEGYTAGFNKSTKDGVWSTISENLGSILVIMMFLGIGFFVMHDKIIASPAIQGSLNTCNEQKAEIINQCSKYVNLDFGQNKKPDPVIPTPPNAPKTGSAVK